ncbi:portal protein [Saccharibacter floricola]|uniref:Phage head-tail connector protein n=1 Tax=Saccharibacter floricola DSM 15669 TaxID=1123227 RepID=A0ABQ0P0Z7_9PROT|nr:portal protein [Saccharibacter floricola]GBQ07887.1 phage head-tail connector protein [Saccharibacter floricola DSM 15669]
MAKQRKASPTFDMDNRSSQQSLRDEADRRLVMMRSDRLSWRDTWREISHYILPTRGRYFHVPNQGSRGRVKGPQIVDKTGSIALGNLSAFLMAGITSPARDWFRLETNNDQLNDDPQVKLWLSDTKSRLQRVFATGNFYASMSQTYEELAGFGTAACIILQDYEDVVRFYPLTAGEYYLAQNARGEVDTLFREYVQNVAQIVQRFGLENVSPTVRSLWESRQLTQELPIVHAIMPNSSRIAGAFGWKSAPYIGIYYEYGNDTEPALLVESYPRKPFIAPRWATVSNDAYGHGPGEDALPDIKSLQVAQLRLAEAVDKYARPPTMADASLQESMVNLLPGGLNFIPGLAAAGNGAGIRPVYQVNPNISPLQERIAEFQDQVRKTLRNDLILMVSQEMGSTQPVTAAEINVRQQEKMLTLGPVLERFHNEALDPIITTTLEIMERGGLLQPRPPGLHGHALKIAYSSILAQAQRATETTGIEQLVRFAGSVAGADPSIMDNLDLDAALDRYGDLLGVDPSMLKNPQSVAQLRQQRAYQQQQQQMAEQAQQMAAGAKNLSQADVGGGSNALQAIMSGLNAQQGQ